MFGQKLRELESAGQYIELLTDVPRNIPRMPTKWSIAIWAGNPEGEVCNCICSIPDLTQEAAELVYERAI